MTTCMTHTRIKLGINYNIDMKLRSTCTLCNMCSMKTEETSFHVPKFPINAYLRPLMMAKGRYLLVNRPHKTNLSSSDSCPTTIYSDMGKLRLRMDFQYFQLLETTNSYLQHEQSSLMIPILCSLAYQLLTSDRLFVSVQFKNHALQRHDHETMVDCCEVKKETASGPSQSTQH